MKPTRSQAAELIETLFDLDWASSYRTPHQAEIVIADIEPNEVHAKIDAWLEEKGIDEGVEILPDTIDGDFGCLECSILRIQIGEVMQ